MGLTIGLTNRPRVSRRLWTLWEKVFKWGANVRPLQIGEQHLFLVSKRRFMGRRMTVDNTVLRRFDRIIELHMNNDMLMQILQESQNVIAIGVRLIKEARRALPVLAERVVQSEYDGAQIVLGITFIHRGVTKLGFNTIPVPNPMLRLLMTWYLKKIFRMVNPQANTLIHSHADGFVPKIVVISKQKLTQLHLPSSPLQENHSAKTDR
jgi:hypothetical protein